MTCGFVSMRQNPTLQYGSLSEQTRDHKAGPQALYVHVTISLTTAVTAYFC